MTYLGFEENKPLPVVDIITHRFFLFFFLVCVRVCVQLRWSGERHP